MLKKPIWSATETTRFYYSGNMYSWSSVTLKKAAPVILEKEKKIRTLILPTSFNRWTYRSSFQGNLKPEDKIIHVFTTKNTKKEVM